MSLWREMLIEDVPHVHNIAKDIWTMHKESRIIYENKFCSFPDGCYVYDDNGIKGYVISHPYNISSSPKKNALFGHCYSWPSLLLNIKQQHQMISKSARRQYSDFPPGSGLRIMNGNAFCCSSSCAIKYPSMIFLSVAIIG